jgi:hypothetical protein
MITRRQMLIGGVAALGVAGLGAYGLGRIGLKLEIEAILRKRLGFLKLDPTGVRAFAKDQTAAVFNKKIPTWNRLRYHFGSVGPSFERFYRTTDHRSRALRLEDTLVQTYLLSTDFFQNGADESKLVEYIAYYDPRRPCQNPFARSAMSSAST